MPRLVQPIPVDLDKRRHLLLKNAPLWEAEMELSRRYGKKISIYPLLARGLLPDGEQPGLLDVIVLLYYGLRHEDPDLTLEQVSEAVNLENYSALVEAIYTSWGLVTRSAEPEAVRETEDQADPLAMSSPGSDSGASPASSLALAMSSSGT